MQPWGPQMLLNPAGAQGVGSPGGTWEELSCQAPGFAREMLQAEGRFS